MWNYNEFFSFGIGVSEAYDVLSAIGKAAGDDETQHAMEDEAYHAFVLQVSIDPRIPTAVRDAAKVLLTSEKMYFARWCA